MIQANELRIGNLVFRDELNIENGKWDELTIKINYQDIFNLINGNDMVKTAYNPIPLTEEWLVKLGFDYLYISDNGITFRFEKIGSDWICHIDDSIILEIQYVHTLQNIFFALTGKELTIKN